MRSPFHRSLSALEADSPRRNSFLLGLAVVLIALWGAWFTAARISVFAVSAVARLEVDREHHPVSAPVTGRITWTAAALGRVVRAGDVLAELDATAEHLAREEEAARLAPASSQLAALREELAAQSQALEQEQHSAEAAREEAEARVRQARAAEAFGRLEATRLAQLHAGGLVSEVEALRAENLAVEREAEARAAEFSVGRLVRESEARRQIRMAEIAGLRRQIAVVEGARAGAAAAANRITFDIEQRVVRAPISGTIAEVSPFQAGGLISAGSRLCTIVPDGEIRAVAFFRPEEALGRVQPGQTARVRLQAFPWTQYGSIDARVTGVAGELHDGRIRVDLQIDAAAAASLPLQHGAPAEVGIRIEEASPLALLLRSIGAYTSVAAMQR